MSEIIDITTFIRNFESNFEPELANTFTEELKFKELDEWNSMQALIVIAFLDEAYSVTIDGADLKSCLTVGDLYRLVLAKST